MIHTERTVELERDISILRESNFRLEALASDLGIEKAKLADEVRALRDTVARVRLRAHETQSKLEDLRALFREELNDIEKYRAGVQQ